VLGGLDGGAHLRESGVTTSTLYACAGSGLRRRRGGHRKGDRGTDNDGYPEQPHTEAEPVPDQEILVLTSARAPGAIATIAPTRGSTNAE
jgi:hypothetical protein